jgi:hypothetical protein
VLLTELQVASMLPRGPGRPRAVGMERSHSEPESRSRAGPAWAQATGELESLSALVCQGCGRAFDSLCRFNHDAKNMHNTSLEQAQNICNLIQSWWSPFFKFPVRKTSMSGKTERGRWGHGSDIQRCPSNLKITTPSGASWRFRYKTCTSMVHTWNKLGSYMEQAKNMHNTSLRRCVYEPCTILVLILYFCLY